MTASGAVTRPRESAVTTVKTHIVALLDKLSLRNRVQAGILAHRLGLVDDKFRPTGR